MICRQLGVTADSWYNLNACNVLLAVLSIGEPTPPTAQDPTGNHRRNTEQRNVNDKHGITKYINVPVRSLFVKALYISTINPLSLLS